MLRFILNQRFRVYTVIICVLYGLLVSSCATTQSTEAPPVFKNREERRAWIYSLKSAEASGRFSFKQGNEGNSGSFIWKQYAPQNYKIHFTGLLGFGSAYLTVNKNEAVWQDSSGITTAESPDSLILIKLHSMLPVSDLYNWILGRTNSGRYAATIAFDKNGRLTQLNQSGWTIRYLAYTPVGSGELPTKIEMTSDDIKIKIIIDQWKID